MRLQPDEVEAGVAGIESLLNALGMAKRLRLFREAEPVYYESTWIRANSGGIFIGNVKLGQRVKGEDLLGTITDPITNRTQEIRAPMEGRVLGMALNQVVMPGFAAFRLGLPTSAEAMISGLQQEALSRETKNADINGVLYAIRGQSNTNGERKADPEDDLD